MTLTNAALAQQANFVNFAYKMFKAGGLQPPPDPGIDAAGYKLTHYLQGKDLGTASFYGYLAESKTNPADLILVVRGTENFKEWLLDFAAIPVHMKNIGFVALGFLSIFNSFTLVDSAGASLGLIAAVEAIAAAKPIESLNVIGHSLGAALSSLAAVQLATANPAGIQAVLASLTFASPRVGLLDFASHFNKFVKNSYRVWNTLDIVPEFPTFPYIHVSGKGDELVQTDAQLHELTFSPPCEHHLTSYLWLLDPANFSLDSDCQHVVSTNHSVLSEAAGVSPDHAEGVVAMRKGARGRA